MPKFSDVFKGWNIFRNNKDPANYKYQDLGASYSYRPDRTYYFRGNDKTIITSIYNRLANDVASCDIEHVKTDENGQYLETYNSGLNYALTISANIDQTGRELLREAVLTMFDDGYVCFLPIETETNPDSTGTYDIYELRVAKVTEWFPRHVRVKAYDERTGRTEEMIVPKAVVSIVENPFYSVMNAPNSTLKRLTHKLQLLDVVDEQSSSGKLDIIIQYPYLIKTEEKKKQADARRAEIERQLAGSKYGIAYTDSTEHITQLNRAVENNLLAQVEFLTSMLYGQLGLTAEILNGTADEKAMLNYTSRSIEPLITAITEDMTRKFLTKTAISQHQRIKFFKDPFKLVPISDLAESVQIFTSNEILTSNEVRGIIGYKPINTERANSLLNKNINTMEGEEEADVMSEDPAAIEAELAQLDQNEKELDEFEASLVHSDEDFIMHYASKYYDPQKAHEYYEAHKKLKGRNSAAGLNEAGKEVWYGVKNAITGERKEKKERAAAARDEEISVNANVLSSKISSLRDEYAALPAAEKRARARIYQRQIEQLRMTNAQAKAKLQSKYKQLTGQIDDDYEQTLTSEYEKIASDPKYQQQKKTSKKSSSKKSDNTPLADSWTRASDRKTKMYRTELKGH